MNRLRLALFGSGSPLACRAFSRLAETHEIVAVVLPRRPMRSVARRLLRRTDPTSALALLAQARNVPVLRFEDTPSLCDAGLDLSCVASFPHRLPQTVLDMPSFGTLNVHSSLLPRHRGPDPLFWTYFCDDRETGVTIHWMDAQLDTGPIAAQKRMSLTRGTPGIELYMRTAEEGAAMLLQTVDEVAKGTAVARAQDETAATSEPSPSSGTWRVDYSNWHAERLWHFLRGTAQYGFPLVDRAGRRHLIADATSFHEGASPHPGGTVTSNSGTIRIYTADGWVEAVPRTAADRWRFRLRRLTAGF